ncbi:MAG: M24 family metallopeptidase [Syntrophorhabdaceae bacterium]
MEPLNRQPRVQRLQRALADMGLEGCALKGMDNIFYLTGFRGSEGTLLVTRGDVILLVDFRYITYAREVTSGIQIIEMKASRDMLYDLCTRYKISTLGFDGAHLSYNVYKTWSDNLVGISLVPMNNAIEEIRQNKEPEEIIAILDAISIATEAFNDIVGMIKPGETEKNIADELDYAMRKRGASNPSFETIVASGHRAALPHAEPSGKQLKQGETVIIDFGATVSGYSSDETVTLCLGQIPDKLSEIYTIANDARKLGIENAIAGTPIKSLDAIVRGYIDDRGYGEYFRHGTGHGVGIAIHEAPAINSAATGILEEDMVVTIEPGIYLPNIGGVRLEDMILITDGVPRILTHIRKDIMKL